jgi:hypothetical protein
MTHVVRHAVDQFLETCRDAWAEVSNPTPYEKRKAAKIAQMEGKA